MKGVVNWPHLAGFSFFFSRMLVIIGSAIVIVKVNVAEDRRRPFPVIRQNFSLRVLLEDLFLHEINKFLLA